MAMQLGQITELNGAAMTTHPADGNSEFLMLAVPLMELLDGQRRQEIHAAERTGMGLYGICEVCEQKIDPRRLRILPYATTCVSCASQTK